jgi:RimJ/RimL family protein N-acetyltransferase
MELELPGCRIRSWRVGDEPALARHADNRKVWLNVRDRFPHPYTAADAKTWVAKVTAATPETQFAIEVDGEAAGGIGLFLQEDVARYSAELGYWLGESHWGRGLMTSVVRGFTEFAFGTFALCRIYAVVFEWNPASMRVLEKAGYSLEGHHRRAAVKDGRVLDQRTYAVTRDPRGDGDGSHHPGCGEA